MSDQGCRRQGWQKTTGQAVFLLALLVLGLAACGKKPGHLDPPPDVTEDNFPLIYPDPDTDPKPQ